MQRGLDLLRPGNTKEGNKRERRHSFGATVQQKEYGANAHSGDFPQTPAHST